MHFFRKRKLTRFLIWALSHYAQEVAHQNVDKPVDTMLQRLYFITRRRVRKKLHSTAQLLAQLSGRFD